MLLAGFRIELAQFLCNEVKRMYGDRVRYHFLHPCEGVDFDNRIVKLGTPSGEDLQVRSLADDIRKTD